jgi:hypothetical protein
VPSIPALGKLAALLIGICNVTALVLRRGHAMGPHFQ